MNLPQVRPAQLPPLWAAMAAEGLSAVLLDVREPWELAMAPVQSDALPTLALPMQQVPANLDKLDPQQPVFVLCHHGMRSQQVALFLQERGYQRIYNVAGGSAAWSAELDASVPIY